MKNKQSKVKELYEILKFCRPADGVGESTMINTFIKPLGVTEDKAGNLYKRIGKNPTVMWSCHTDTVHGFNSKETQTITVDSGTNPTRIFKTDKECLGADCGTGVWLMMQMIRAGIRGLYIFHRGEECGGIGSNYISSDTPELLEGIDKAIAFDRYGYDSVITHQGGERTCSDAFGNDLIELLSSVGGYRLDSNGSFTDTLNYSEQISECTNISVGYFNQHTNKEYQDIFHALALCELLCRHGNKFSKLVAKRDPSVRDYKWYGTSWRNQKVSQQYSVYPQYEDVLVEKILDFPEMAAGLLRKSFHQLSDEQIAQAIEDRYYMYGEDDDQIPW